jgi:hypothetical protein
VLRVLFAGHEAVVVALVHPCYRHIISARRDFGADRAAAAEEAMLRHAMAESGYGHRQLVGPEVTPLAGMRR